MKIYNEVTKELMLEGIANSFVNEEKGYFYNGQIQTGMTKSIPEKWEVLPGTITDERPEGLRRRMKSKPSQPIFEDCVFYHEYTKEEKINLLKTKLNASDYAIIKIAEGSATQEEYAVLIASRKAWREEINELEKADNKED